MSLHMPDWAFVKKLKRVSQRLGVEFDRDIERWVITVKSKDIFGRVYRVYVVQNDNGSYRPLDDRTIRILKEANLQRHRNYQKYLYEKDQAAFDKVTRRNTKARDDIKHATLDSKRQLAKAFEPFHDSGGNIDKSMKQFHGGKDGKVI